MADVNVLSKQSRFPLFLDYVGYFGMHAACLGAFWTGVKWSDIALCFALYLVRMFGLMAGYHRYFSHRSFKTSRTVQFLLGLLGSLGYQKGPLWWASHHRYHHRYSDTYLDYHSPLHRSFLYSHSGWFLDSDNRQTKFDRVGDLARYPELVWLDDWNLIPVFIMAILLLLLFGWSGFIWGFCINTILIWHAIHAIGSFGHRFGGYRRFATTDNSRNKWFIAIALLGEGWHNNHHFYPSSARQGFVWWEIDVAYYVLRVMCWLGLIWDLRLPPERLIRGNGLVAQGHLRRFELWLVDLRLEIAQLVESSAKRNDAWKPENQFPLQLFKQSIEIRLDDFATDVIEYLHSDPEQIKEAVAALRSELNKEVDAFSERLGKEIAFVLLPRLENELCRHLLNCPFSHLLLEREEAKQFVLEPSC
jgi:stearoyl-CoA desaturase (delta-9 desaturase)